MVIQISKLSADVLKIIEALSEAEKNPGKENYQMTEEEIKLIADYQHPNVQAALNLGLVQLCDALVQDLASQGPLPASVVEALGATHPATDYNAPINPYHYPNAFYEYNSPHEVSTQSQSMPPPQSTPSRSRSPRSGATRRSPSKRKYETLPEPLTTCQWNSCGQVVENFSRSAVVSHLLSQHRIDSKSQHETIPCGWTGCGENILSINVAKHVTSAHLRLTVMECPYCPQADKRSFSRGDGLNAHIRIEHAKNFDRPSPKKSRVY